MPRIRSIKPEWLDDEKLCQVSDEARVMSVALILLADDFGNGRAHEMFLASHIWSYENTRESLRKSSRAFDELLKIGFVSVYEVGNQTYFHVTNWEKHQKISHPSKTGMVPQPCDAREDLRKDSRETLEELGPDLDQEKDQEKDQESLSKKSTQVFQYWQSKAENGRSRKFTDDRKKKIKARLMEGYAVDDLCCAIDGCFANAWFVENGRTDIVTIFKTAASTDQHLYYRSNNNQRELSNVEIAKPDGASEMWYQNKNQGSK